MGKGFHNTAYTFDMGINTLDVDRYLPSGWDKRLNDDEVKFDFSSLKDLKLRGILHAGEIKIEINDGSAHGSELKLKSSLFMCKGSCEITLDSGNIDYQFDTTISNTLKRQSSGALAGQRAGTCE